MHGGHAKTRLTLSINFRPGIPILVAVACNTPSGLPIEIKSSFAGGDDEGALWCGRSRRSCGCDPADAGSEVRGGVANAAALLDELARRGALEVEVGREFGSTEAYNTTRVGATRTRRRARTLKENFRRGQLRGDSPPMRDDNEVPSTTRGTKQESFPQRLAITLRVEGQLRCE
ncbi:hypothetical protein BGZ60DRAFT_429657 [Tricladium varicosporioides]|nr:hypothetical protein BGZ60DRAFT_429657 [Hymenoscyphus varicosporioides]